ncbi:MAG: hypothetical protein KAH84_01320 [Thiomargarita sp.]|nr:hypothetical protein [Thiomargarita sp.]
MIEQRLNLPVYAIIPHSLEQVKLDKQNRKEVTIPKILAVEHPKEMAI